MRGGVDPCEAIKAEFADLGTSYRWEEDAEARASLGRAFEAKAESLWVSSREGRVCGELSGAAEIGQHYIYAMKGQARRDLIRSPIGRAVIAYSPRYASQVYQNLGISLYRADSNRAAVDALTEALRQADLAGWEINRVDRANIHISMAWALEDMDRYAESLEHYHIAGDMLNVASFNDPRTKRLMGHVIDGLGEMLERGYEVRVPFGQDEQSELPWPLVYVLGLLTGSALLYLVLRGKRSIEKTRAQRRLEEIGVGFARQN